jgi:hypothetical protein
VNYNEGYVWDDFLYADGTTINTHALNGSAVGETWSSANGVVMGNALTFPSGSGLATISNFDYAPIGPSSYRGLQLKFTFAIFTEGDCSIVITVKDQASNGRLIATVSRVAGVGTVSANTGNASLDTPLVHYDAPALCQWLDVDITYKNYNGGVAPANHELALGVGEGVAVYDTVTRSAFPNAFTGLSVSVATTSDINHGVRIANMMVNDLVVDPI